MIRVLIAEGNVELCRTLTEHINTRTDMRVVGVAHDGEQALAIIRPTAPDVLVLDIDMPVVDGLSVLARLGEQGLSKKLTVMVLSTLDTHEIVRKIMDLGAHYFITKPFDIQVLLERVRQFASTTAAGCVSGEASSNHRTSSPINHEGHIAHLLHEMGVPLHYKGYNYLRDAVAYVLRDPAVLDGSLTTRLYPEIARQYATTPTAVESAIRNCIIASWQSGNRDFVAHLTGCGDIWRKTFPANSVVIAKLAEAARLKS